MSDKPSPLRQARRSQSERRETAEKLIIEAAVTIIAERGLSGLTLAAAGESAGYSRGIASHHFGRKDELLIAIVNHITSEFSHYMSKQLRVKPGMEMIRAVIREYFSRASRDPGMVRALHLVLSEAITNPALAAPLAEANNNALKGLAFNLRHGIVNGEINPNTDPEAYAVILLAGMRGVTAQWFISTTNIDLQKVRDEFLLHIERSLSLSATTTSGNAHT